MKRIAIFCDGTWNRHDAKVQTHVVKLAQIVRHTAQDGVKQQVFYVPGVGSGRGAHGIARMIDRWAGGAFGWGLDQNIEEAYRNLVFCYEPGDSIYIFGFSRGAYMARSLAGLIRACGIPPRAHLARVGQAMQRYRQRARQSHRPDSEESFAFRADFAPFTYTSEAEYHWRLKNRPGMCSRLDITYLGVWDTVGALGVPRHWLLAKVLNKEYEFHDLELSSAVRAARHAVAIDETRRAYAPTLWQNLDDLNAVAAARDPSLWAGRCPSHPVYRQSWFPGDHGTVGGGRAKRGLSTHALAFVADGAAEAHLDLDRAALTEDGRLADVMLPAVETQGIDMLSRIMRRIGAARDAPPRAGDVSDWAVLKLRSDRAYNPGPLRRLRDALLARPEAPAPAIPDPIIRSLPDAPGPGTSLSGPDAHRPAAPIPDRPPH